jgi:DNA-binding transcriptional LysR family regulator
VSDALDQLTSMAVFARVVEARSFSGAARVLGVSKSAVSKRVARLEDSLGAPLLLRSTRRLALTEVGAAFYQHCARIVSEAEEARSQITDSGTSPRGLLRINAPVTFSEMYLAPVMPRFLARHRELQVELTTDDRFINVVDEGYDVVVRVGHLEDSSLIARRLATDRRIVCASPAYLSTAGVPRHPRDLLQHNCLRYAYMTVRDEWQFHSPEGKLSVSVRGNFQANNGALLKQAAIDAIGIGMIPRFMIADALNDGRLVSVLDEFAPPEHGIYAVHAQRRHMPPKVRAFVDFLVDALSDFDPMAPSTPTHDERSLA